MNSFLPSTASGAPVGTGVLPVVVHPVGRRARLSRKVSAPRANDACASLPRRAAGFTLIELLVVISVIAILAALALPALTGALQSARKAEVRAMANQIKMALTSYYAEYGYYPTNSTNTDANFVLMMTTNNTNNRRGIRFLEVPNKFSNASGLVTPKKFFKTGQSNFSFVCDTNYDGQITVPVGAPGGATTNISASVAVFVADPTQTNKVIGTW